MSEARYSVTLCPQEDPWLVASDATGLSAEDAASMVESLARTLVESLIRGEPGFSLTVTQEEEEES